MRSPRVNPLEWMDDALCTQSDPDMFNPEQGASVRAPKTVCAACDVREQCLQWAVSNGIKGGVYGGLSDVERRKLRRTAA